ncbi:GNAT family N-acetyltransferase [Inconstantimicrobium porci]|uniref:GNAT family N-acetyltransferase n=1 Tax=Inconstantimicrobium porci TaxID=2652291 RepID=UPI0034DE02CA
MLFQIRYKGDGHDRKQAEIFIDKNTGDDIEEYAVVLNSENKLIGHIVFHEWYAPFKTWEIGWVFNNSYHNKGYATEAAKAVLKYAFEDLKLHRVIATCDTENTASYKVMEKIGMRREGHNIRCVYIKGKWQDEYFYAIHDEEWKK